MDEAKSHWRVLVVEDEAKVARALREGLERQKYEVVVAPTGEEGFFLVNEEELTALRKNGLDVVAIHHHMTGDRPLVIFLHYWGRGPAEKLATGFKAALDELGKGTAGHEMAH